MGIQRSIREILEIKSNDYSRLEPFTDKSPIPSSIVIPVYNHARIFQETLENISSHPEINKNPSGFEVTIVNDGSTENIDSLVAKTKFPCDMNYISYGKNRGRSYARNQGIQRSSKDLLFFFDADVLLPQDYFSRMWKIHSASQNILSVGLAQNIPYGDDRLKDVNAKNIFPNITDDFRYNKKFPKGKFGSEEYWLIEETDWFKRFGNNTQIGLWTLPKMAVAHNMSVRSKNARDVGGFDERFKIWGYEDTHFGAKLIANGCYIIPSQETGAIRILNGAKKKFFRDDNHELYDMIIRNEPL